MRRGSSSLTAMRPSSFELVIVVTSDWCAHADTRPAGCNISFFAVGPSSCWIAVSVEVKTKCGRDLRWSCETRPHYPCGNCQPHSAAASRTDNDRASRLATILQTNDEKEWRLARSKVPPSETSVCHRDEAAATTEF